MSEPTQNQFNKAPRPVMPPRPSAQQSDAALTPKDIITILRRHLLLISVFTFLGILVGGTSWYLLSKYAPKYTARTVIKVLSPIEQDPTQIGGPIVQKDIQYGYRLSIATLIKQQNNLQNLVERQAVQETSWFQQQGETKAERISESIMSLEDDFGANAQRDGDFIVLSMTCGNKREAALIVNEMVDLFLSSRQVAERGDVSQKLANLNEQRMRVEQELNAAEDALDEVRNRWGFTDLERDRGDNNEHTVEVQVKQLDSQLDELLLQMEQVQSNIKNLERQATAPLSDNEQVERQIESDPIMLNLGEQLASQQSYLSSLLARFGEEHRVVQQQKERIESLKRERILRQNEISRQVRQANLKNAQDQLSVLAGRLERLQELRDEAMKKKRDLDLARAQFRERVTIRDEREKTLNEVKGQIEKIKMLYEDPKTAKVAFVANAPVPLEASFPKLIIFVPGGTMLGLMLGVGLAFLLEMMNDLVRTPRDVGRYLRVPLLCVSPHEDDDHLAGDVDDLYKITRLAPYSMTSECYRQLKTNLQLSEFGDSSRVLFFSSGMPQEGKTSVAVNLGITLAAEEKKVLIVDANFWQPMIYRVFPPEGFEIPKKKSRKNKMPAMDKLTGLSDILTGLDDYSAAVRSTDIENLDVIDSGKPPANPVEILGSSKIKELLDSLRDKYDYILVDGPPVLLVSDAKLLARNVDGTILVFNATSTKRGAALRTIRELKEVNVSIMGSVLFAARALKGGYFQQQFKIYQDYQNPELAKAK